MNSDYLNYLLWIGGVVAMGVILWAVLRRGKRSACNTAVDPVRGGNVSIFFDKAGNVVVIPYVKDKFGMGKATTSVQFLKQPYSPQGLGALLRSALNGCLTGIPCENRELMARLGALDWNRFSEGKKNISVYFREEHGIIFNTTRRKENGAYEFLSPGMEKVLPAETGDEMLGSTLLQLLQRCRC